MGKLSGFYACSFMFKCINESAQKFGVWMISSCKVNVPFEKGWVVSCVSNTFISSFVKLKKKPLSFNQREFFLSVLLPKSVLLFQRKNGSSKTLLTFGRPETFLSIKHEQYMKWNIGLKRLFYKSNIFLFRFFNLRNSQNILIGPILFFFPNNKLVVANLCQRNR